MTNMMGPATFEKSHNGVDIAVWLITQEEHKKRMHDRMKDEKHMMQMNHGMMHDSKDTSKSKHMMHDMEGMDNETKRDKSAMDAMMAGTHHIMVTLTYEKRKEEMNNAKVFVTATSPAKKLSTITLSQMMNHLGGALELGEKGAYAMKIAVKAGEKRYEAQFSYEVK